jgi:hypothetical protein
MPLIVNIAKDLKYMLDITIDACVIYSNNTAVF